MWISIPSTRTPATCVGSCSTPRHDVRNAKCCTAISGSGEELATVRPEGIRNPYPSTAMPRKSEISTRSNSTGTPNRAASVSTMRSRRIGPAWWRTYSATPRNTQHATTARTAQTSNRRRHRIGRRAAVVGRTSSSSRACSTCVSRTLSMRGNHPESRTS